MALTAGRFFQIKMIIFSINSIGTPALWAFKSNAYRVPFRGYGELETELGDWAITVGTGVQDV
jgi:hypothetical protein